MATYEYKCTKCKEVFELNNVPISKMQRTAECPKCDGEGKIVMSKNSFTFRNRRN